MASASAAPRPLIPAALAGLVGLGLALAVPLRAGLGGSPSYVVAGAAVAGGLGAIVLLAGLATGWQGVPGWAVALLAAEYAIAVFGERGRLDLAAPLVGTLLVLTAELAYTSCEWRGPHAIDVNVERRRWLRLIGTAVGGGLLGLGALLVTSAAGSPPPAILVVGAAAAVAVVVLVAVLHARV